MFDIVTVLLFLLVLLLSAWYLVGPKNMPPGPIGLPIFGSVFFARNNKRLHLDLLDMSKKYGKVFSMWFGSRPLVVVTGYRHIHEALVEKADYFSERPDWLYITSRITENKGIIWNHGQWKGMRKLGLTSLKDFGLGKSSLEDKVTEEIGFLLEEMNKHNGEPFNCQMLMPNAVANIIASIVFARRFEYTDEEFQKMSRYLSRVITQNVHFFAPNFIPWLLYPMMIIDKASMGIAVPFFDYMREFINDKIKDHRLSYDSENIRDFTDLYIKACDDFEGGKLSEKDGFRAIIDLFVAGTETTSTTLQWLILYMIHYPEVQERCRREIHQVIGTSRMVTSKDRGSLPYTEATLLEVQRIVTIVPLSLPHTAIADCQLGGYTIPKGAFVVPHLYSVHHDPEYWPEPDKLKPERWLGPDDKLIKHDAFMPFSTGRRVCLGEQLARLEIFMFGVALLQHFDIRQGDTTKPSLVPNQGITLLPKPFNMRAVRL